MPVYIGSEEQYKPFIPKDIKPVPAQGKQDPTDNAIFKLYSLYRGVKCNLSQQEGPVHQSEFTVHVNVNGLLYEGIGPSKKKAKLLACEKALEAHTRGLIRKCHLSHAYDSHGMMICVCTA